MFIVIGLVLIGIAVGLYFARQRALNKVMNIKYHETSKASDVVSIYNELKLELGEGNYSGNIVELSGIGSSSNPLMAEHSNSACLYYKAQVTREYEYTETERDSEGNSKTVTRRGSETVSNNERYIPFYLDDGSGAKIMVDMEGAEKHTVQSVDRFENNAPSGFSINIGGGYSNSRTLGFRYKEHIIPNNSKLYVLGEASDRRGEFGIIKPKDSKDNNFIVSTKSEEEIIKSTQSSAGMYMVFAIIAAIAGVGSIIYQFFAK